MKQGEGARGDKVSQIEADYCGWFRSDLPGPDGEKLDEALQVIQHLAAKRMGEAIRLLDPESQFCRLVSGLRDEYKALAEKHGISVDEKTNELMWWLNLTVRRTNDFSKALLEYCKD